MQYYNAHNTSTNALTFVSQPTLLAHQHSLEG